MNEYVNLIGLFIAQITQATKQTIPQAAQSKDLLITYIPVIATLAGVVLGVVTAWKNISDIYRSQVESIEQSYKAEKRSIELLLQQRESDIQNLKERIKRMEGFYAINFPEIDKVKGKNTLERLNLLLQYLKDRIQNQDAQLSSELQKMQDFITI